MAKYDMEGVVFGDEKLITRMAKLSRRAKSGCLLWTGWTDWVGYGKLTIWVPKHQKKSNKLAHRVAYCVHVGEIPHGINVLHSCDVRNCIEPTHLFLGTQDDNLKDMKEKNRHNNYGNRKTYNK